MQAARSVLLQHILQLAPFDGWSDYTFAQAVKKANLSVAEAQAAFPGGITACMDYFFEEADAHLEARFAEGKLSALRMPDRIETLILAQLDYFTPYREALRRALAAQAMSMPWTAWKNSALFYQTIDRMWRLAGDSSTDFSFYTKRLTLSALYSSTLLFWLNDHSEHHAETIEYIRRRLTNIADFGRWKKQIFS